MSEDIIWAPFNIDKYVNYKRDGFRPIEKIQFDDGHRYFHPYEDGVRRWIKSENNLHYKIEELDIWSGVNYMVSYPSPDGFGTGTNSLLHVGKISWHRKRANERFQLHRDDGPAIIRINCVEKLSKAEWWVNGVDISHDVRPWIKSMGFPVFYKWSTDQKMAFKLAFR